MFERSEALPTVLDALGAPADVAAWAATVPPGADVVGPLAVIEPSTVDGAAQIDLLVALERQIAWLTAPTDSLSDAPSSIGYRQLWRCCNMLRSPTCTPSAWPKR